MQPAFFLQFLVGLFQVFLGLYPRGNILGYDDRSTRERGYRRGQNFIHIPLFGKCPRFARSDAFGQLRIHIYVVSAGVILEHNVPSRRQPVPRVAFCLIECDYTALVINDYCLRWIILEQGLVELLRVLVIGNVFGYYDSPARKWSYRCPQVLIDILLFGKHLRLARSDTLHQFGIHVYVVFAGVILEHNIAVIRQPVARFAFCLIVCDYPAFIIDNYCLRGIVLK